MSEGTIKFVSSRFGEQEVPESSVIELVDGLIGFPDVRKFVLLDYNPPFSWLHSIELSDLAFVVVNGAEFGDNYSFPLPKNDAELDFGENPDFAVVNLVSVRPHPMPTTVNLKAPIVVNLKNKRGRQLVLDMTNFPTQLPLWAEPKTEDK